MAALSSSLALVLGTRRRAQSIAPNNLRARAVLRHAADGLRYTADAINLDLKTNSLSVRYCRPLERPDRFAMPGKPALLPTFG